jgi:hypothetical protein
MFAKRIFSGATELAGVRSLVLVAGIVSLVLVYAQQPAGATFPGTPARKAYWAFDGHDHEIYTIEADGGGKRQVTHNSVDDFDSSWGSR